MLELSAWCCSQMLKPGQIPTGEFPNYLRSFITLGPGLQEKIRVPLVDPCEGEHIQGGTSQAAYLGKQFPDMSGLTKASKSAPTSKSDSSSARVSFLQDDRLYTFNFRMHMGMQQTSRFLGMYLVNCLRKQVSCVWCPWPVSPVPTKGLRREQGQ